MNILPLHPLRAPSGSSLPGECGVVISVFLEKYEIASVVKLPRKDIQLFIVIASSAQAGNGDLFFPNHFFIVVINYYLMSQFK